MKYTVVWKPPAEEELASLWTASADRQPLRSAADQIDRLLGSDPANQGESRSTEIRVLLLSPLGVFFHINEADRTVSVLRVWRIH